MSHDYFILYLYSCEQDVVKYELLITIITYLYLLENLNTQVVCVYTYLLWLQHQVN